MAQLYLEAGSEKNPGWLLALCMGCSIPLLPVAAVSSSFPKSPDRLPGSIFPSSYDLHIEPDLAKSSFTGLETISIDIRQPVREVLLNAAELKVSDVNFQAEPGGQNTSARPVLDAQHEILHLFPQQSLAAGKYKLKLSFNGILNDKLRGFYRSRYKDSAGATKLLAATQMEPTDARRMFPCFDEPSFKATFKITAAIDPNFTAISNAPVQSESQDKTKHKKIIVFAETPRMSTYLVALVVGRFQGTAPMVVAGVPIRVWSATGSAASRDYALKTAAAILPFYNQYFGIPYPAAKLDLIAVPDFEAGAMENLGAITFRETALLADPKSASTRTKQRVAGVVAHEMAHMWFGDLVTMSWWDDLWLNEAFATWMSVKAVNFIRPDWHPYEQFAADRAYSMNTDSLQSSHPIHSAVSNPHQANEMFDEIIYQKGASILRMLEQFVGEKVFQEGIHNYLDKFKFSNARTEDFWQAIADSSRQPISEIMRGWVFQAGYPVITLTGSNDRPILNQQRFFLDPSHPPSDKKQTWQIPMIFRTLNPDNTTGPKRTLLFTGTQQKLEGIKQPYLANASADGYYRVHYPAESLKLLLPLIGKGMTAPERLMLLSDVWSLSQSGQSPIEQYLDLSRSYTREEDPTVMSTLLGILAYQGRFVENQNRPYFHRYVQSLLAFQKQKLGWKAKAGESDLTAMLRSRVLDALGTYGGDPATIAEGFRQYAAYRQNPASVDPNLLDTIIDIVAFNGNLSDYRKIKRDWLAARTPEAEERNFMSLGAFLKLPLIERTLPLCLSGDVKTQDAPHLLSRLASNEVAKHATWEYIKKNWNIIRQRYPENMVPHLVSALNSLNTDKDLSDFKAFFSAHPLFNGKKSITQTIERIQINVYFRKHSATALNNFLKRNYH